MKLPFIAKLIFNRYFFEKIGVLFLLGVVLYTLQAFFLIILFTFLFAFLFQDLSKFLRNKFTYLIQNTKGTIWSPILERINTLPIMICRVYVVFICIVSVVIYGLVPQLLNEIRGLVKITPQITNQIQFAIGTIQSQINFDLGFQDTLSNLIAKWNIEEYLKNIYENLKSAGIFIAQITIALVLSFVFLLERPKIEKYVSRIKNGNFSFLHDQFSMIFEKIGKGFGLIFKAQAIIAFVNALLTTAWLLIISFIHGGQVFPFIATLAVIVFIFGFIPVLGFFVSSIPILLIGFNYGWMQVVAAIVVMIAVVHAIEAYFLNPKIVSSYMEFPVFITFIILLLSEHFLFENSNI